MVPAMDTIARIIKRTMVSLTEQKKRHTEMGSRGDSEVDIESFL